MSLRKIEKVVPKAGQESVWDYPRPPKLEAVSDHVRILLNQQIVVDTNQSLRMLETSHPPVYYLPKESFAAGCLIPADKQSFCEFKGMARYFHISVGERTVEFAAWYYPEPNAAYARLIGHVAVYPSKMDMCLVSDEVVQAQVGDFYGGWITEKIVGPFKGGPGTWGW